MNRADSTAPLLDDDNDARPFTLTVVTAPTDTSPATTRSDQSSDSSDEREPAAADSDASDDIGDAGDSSDTGDDDLDAQATADLDDTSGTVTTDLIRLYLNEIGRIPLLSAADEVELSKTIEAGVFAAEKLAGPDKIPAALQRDLTHLVRMGEAAKERMVGANLRLVVSNAKRYTGRGMPMHDLIQEGNLGLIRAVEKFDYTKGYKFSTYATWWIKQAITRAMADQSRTIRLPVHMVETLAKLRRADRELGVELGRKPTDAEVAQFLDLTVDKIEELRGYGMEPTSLDAGIGEDGDTTFGDLIEDTHAAAPDEIAAAASLRDAIDDVMSDLTDRERHVILARFGLLDGAPRDYRELSSEYGLTTERIRQVERKTLAKLRHPARSERLVDFMEMF